MGSSVILPAPGQPAIGPDPTFKTAAVPNLVTFGFKNISPPSPLYLTRDSLLGLSAVTNLAAETVFFNIRFLIPVMPLAGQPDKGGPVFPTEPQVGGNSIQIGQQPLVCTPRVRSSVGIALQECYLLSVTAFALNATTRGQTFVRAVVQPSGLSTAGQISLFGNYATQFFTIGWPGNQQLAPTEGPGFTHSIQQANPAAGVDFLFTAATAQRLLVKSMAALFTASAAAANRNIQLVVSDGVNTLYTGTVATVVVAGQAAQVSATNGSVNTPVLPLNELVPLPNPLILEPGWVIRSATLNLQAGDQWSNIWFNVEEWIDLL